MWPTISAFYLLCGLLCPPPHWLPFWFKTFLASCYRLIFQMFPLFLIVAGIKIHSCMSCVSPKNIKQHTMHTVKAIFQWPLYNTAFILRELLWDIFAQTFIDRYSKVLILANEVYVFILDCQLYFLGYFLPVTMNSIGGDSICLLASEEMDSDLSKLTLNKSC